MGCRGGFQCQDCPWLHASRYALPSDHFTDGLARARTRSVSVQQDGFPLTPFHAIGAGESAAWCLYGALNCLSQLLRLVCLCFSAYTARRGQKPASGCGRRACPVRGRGGHNGGYGSHRSRFIMLIISGALHLGAGMPGMSRSVGGMRQPCALPCQLMAEGYAYA